MESRFSVRAVIEQPLKAISHSLAFALNEN
jgi:hypothetical protein